VSTDAAPLSEAELDLLASLDAARTPGPLVLAVSARGEFGIFGGADGEEWIATLPRGRGAEAEAFVAMANALPALLAEVRAARSSLHFNEHVQAHDAEGRYVQGWIVALDAEGRVQLDIVTGAGMPSGRHSEWLANPERCPVYKPSTFRYFSTLADDGTGDVIDNNGRRPGP